MPPKRKAVAADDGDETTTAGLRRSTRRKSSAPAAGEATAGDDRSLPATARGQSTVAAAAAVKKEPRKSVTPVVKHDGEESEKTNGAASQPKAKAAVGPAQASSRKPSQKGKGAVKLEDDTGATEPTAAAATGIDAPAERSYWLLKAEPETRLESGVDVKFSIDDLASRTEPEPWDGIRNYVARNNLRAMRKGDLAFFYHSNCKEPGIVGTMEIVREHSPDLSAHDSKAPYYDPKSKPEDPKWSVVHVEFRSKFAQQIGLKELREMGKPGQPLENMQLLKQSRLSVSRVTAAEWAYLMGVAQERGGASKTA